MTDERPLADRLEDFWDGEFTLQADPAAAAAPASATALDELGPAGIRIGGRDLAVLLAPAYRRPAGPAD
ncbi:hypothetical protein GCM10010193_31110 [Kitasatospora atroaurantiaca]|uniref:Uncharacterized protein n=1 Tax=Kitasatospora atroaurantiaca TaxID=285545 RepID=A0A561ER60_9ACTN|nr:hypothetical protein [Kitasatospora atroaurantiaca]TWE18098.1 hypothetical protein FB465_3147 [Kitasatospora atroaurantiaca]